METPFAFITWVWGASKYHTVRVQTAQVLFCNAKTSALFIFVLFSVASVIYHHPQSENIKWKILYIIHSKLLIASALRSVKKSCIPLLCAAWDWKHALVQRVCLCMAVLVVISIPMVLRCCVQAAFALFSNSPASAAFLISRIK